MLARDFRFRGLNALKPLFKHGRSVRGEGFKVVFQPTDRPRNRFAVVVSKKVHNSAVVRNRIRRRIFSIINELKTSSPTHDVAVIVYDVRLKSRESSELKQDILQAFSSVFEDV